MVGLMNDIDARVVETIESVFREIMGPFGLSSVIVRPGQDHDGDPVIFVTASYALSARAIEPKAVFDLESRLRDAVWSLGERRFVHVIHKFDEAQTVARDR